MKRYLLFIISMLCVSIGTWAAATVTKNQHLNASQYAQTAIRIETTNAGDINAASLSDASDWANMVFVAGPVNEADIIKLNTTYGSYAKIINLTQTTGLNASWLANLTGSAIEGIGLPDGMELNVSNENIKVVYSSNFNGAKNNISEDKGDDEIDVYVQKAGGITTLNMLQNIYLLQYRTINLAGAPGTIDTSASEYTTLSGTQSITINRISNDPYSVDDCNVTVNMTKVTDGSTLADLIATAKDAVIAGGETGICTLTVTGELTANDLIALGGTNMNDATRIDLSGATLASGVSIDDLQIPSSLTSLVLPKNTTVTVGLKTKMTNWTNLSYAYSPSTGVTEKVGEEDHPVVADYVWVNKAGGMAAALTAETSLTTSKYIKVASNVELNASDVDFHLTTALKYLDLRYANFTSAVSSNFVSSSATGYRIILPDDWEETEMATFAGVLSTANVAWAMAGIYSYSGTTLRIHELADDKYMDTALSNSRIVYPGTTAIKIVGTSLGTKLLAALNDAASSVKTITVTASSLNDLTFANPNITTLNVTGLTLNTSPGRITVDDDCTSLTTLNVTDCSLMTVVATGVSNLTTVNLNGTTISGETNLSNTGLTTFTTNSSTKLQGDINLMSTALTSLNTTAEIGTTTGGTGNILLNGTTSLASINVSSAQFKNSTSKIHIDKSTTENSENKDAIDLLSKTETVGESQVAVKTIFVPNGFESSERIHPYAEVENNVSAVAGSSANEDGDKCSITYDATTKVATVHTNEPGHFANMMETRYASYPLGTTFKFDATSQINVADLQALAGTINSADYSWRSNYYYVDLYDLTATDALCNNTTGVIGETISWLRTNDRQFKGLILPKDHTRYGSGISLIQSENPKHEGELSTCSEFIAYFKTKDMVNNVETNLPKKILFTHVYNQTATNSEGIQASNDKLTELLTAHGLNGAATNCPVDLYSVSTNGVVPFDATKLVGDKGYVETFNNEMVGPDTRANIYAYPSAVGEFTTFVDYSSIGVTTTEVLKIDGTVSSDASAVAASINRFTNGPRVLDLKEIKPNSDEFLSALLPALTNSNIEYIILPGNKSKSLVCGTSYTKMANLKAVISSTSTNLVAYIDEAGSLAEARYLATGGSTDGTIFSPSQTGLQSVTLAGHLNASDIAANTTDHFLDGDGHWKTTSGNQKSVALWGEQGTITTIDLKDAVFATQTDMNFSYAGLASLHDIILPTSESMWLIPAECFMGITTFNDLCIPYNYKKIDNAALLNAYCGHITTTDANGALIDNGEHSYTFSANLEEIGTQPGTADANGVHSLDRVVFPQNRGVTDVYVLAHQVPKCYANAFPANMLYGWGGFKGGNFPYCREKYDNSADGSMIFTVLHFPDEASYTAATKKTGSSYEDMEKLYTDINKVYTKKEQTGAVDANGDPVAWPTFAELRRAYNQASNGITWNDWTLEPDENGEVVGGSFIPTAKNAITAGTGEGTYPFDNYEGWHQFVLSQATYVKPGEEQVEIAYREYEKDASWYTFCIPFDMTEEDVIKLMGVPASTEKVKTTTSTFGEHPEEEESKYQLTEVLPEIRTIKSVTRSTSTTTVTIRTSKDLATDEAKKFYMPASDEYVANGTVTIDGAAKDVMIRGGYPYLIKPWKLRGSTISSLGKDIMTRYQFRATQSSIYHSDNDQLPENDCYESFGSGTNKTGTFARPYENHKIQAVGDPGGALTHQDEAHKNQPYNYTYVGQFWKQRLPLHCFYQNSKRLWRHYQNYDDRYFWNPYTCIIMVTDESQEDAAKGGKFRDEDKCEYPASSGLDKDGGEKFNKTLEVYYKNGLDDPFNTASARGYQFFFDDDIMDFDSDGQATAIEVLDGVRIAPVRGKVYNMAGQYVGNSLEGLSKGMYIVNGKKYVIN